MTDARGGGGLKPALRRCAGFGPGDGGLKPALQPVFGFTLATQGGARPRGGALPSEVATLSNRNPARFIVAHAVTKRPPGGRSGAARDASRPYRAWRGPLAASEGLPTVGRLLCPPLPGHRGACLDASRPYRAWRESCKETTKPENVGRASARHLLCREAAA